MIKALKELGKEILQKEGESIILEKLLDTGNLSNVHHLLEIIIDNLEYKGINYCEFSIGDRKEKAYSILYKSAGGHSDVTPTTRLSYDKGSFDYDKFYTRFLQYFKSASKKCIEKVQIDKIGKLLETEKDKIIDEIKNKIDELVIGNPDKKKSKNCIVTLKINGENLSEFECFKETVLEKFYESAYKLDKKDVIGKNKVCCLSHKESEEVFGNANSFAFMTWDKWSFISGGFRDRDVWKNYPVSKDSYLNVEIGKEKIENNMNFKFCHFDYYLIPKLINKSNYSLLDVVNELKTKSDKNREMSNKLKQIADDEDYIFETLSEENNSLMFNFLFYEKSNAAFRILLNIEDVNPSIISKLFKAQENARKKEMFNIVKDFGIEIPRDKKKYPYEPTFTFYTIRSFFYNSNKRGNYDKTFLELTGKIFTLSKISYDLLIGRFIDEFQYLFRNNIGLIISVTNAFVILYFLYNLGILNRKENQKMTYYKEEGNDVEKEFAIFFEQHNEFYDTPEKIVAFLIGVHSQKLINIQKRDKGGSAPFIKRLNDLKIREDILKRIFDEAKNKLMQYGKTYYSKLETLIGKYVSDCNFSRITNNDLSFYFATGMTLSGLFLKKDEDKELNNN